MRNISFRAWHKERKEMARKIVSLHFDDDGNLLSCELEFFDGVKCSYCTEDLFRKEHPVIFLQNTGLKDMNGKEIFEGYIVRVSSSAIGEMMKETRGIEPFNNVVEWKDDRACWYLSGSGPMMYEDSDWKQWEIIGNIYENPELLK